MARAALPRLAALAIGVALVGLTAVPAAGEVVQKNGLIVSFNGSIAPHALSRTGTTPIGVTVEGRVRTASGQLPPSLRQISLEINSNGVLDRRGLPTCRITRLQPTSTEQALAACGAARVGSGEVKGLIVLPEQTPFPFRGRVIAFNSRAADGDPTILAHLYARAPVALAFVLVFRVERIGGTYGTRLVAIVPRRNRRLLRITSFKLHLGRKFEVGGRRRSYLSAGCPAPPGFTGATFPLARASYGFVGGTTLKSVIVRTCHTRG